jgi:hypothetical protein
MARRAAGSAKPGVGGTSDTQASAFVVCPRCGIGVHGLGPRSRNPEQPNHHYRARQGHRTRAPHSSGRRRPRMPDDRDRNQLNASIDEEASPIALLPIGRKWRPDRSGGPA